MARQKDPRRVRDDALRVGVQKLLTGCEGCAQGYFDLARELGATEEDIVKSVALGREEVARGVISRRGFLSGTAVGVTSLTGAGALLAHWNVGSAAASTDGANVAWIVVAQESRTKVVGVDGTGNIVSQIDSVLSAPVRSPDGQTLYVVYSNDVGVASKTTVNGYSAASGARLLSITGRQVSLGLAARDKGFDNPTFAASPDGRYVVVLHQTRSVTAPDAHVYTKQLPPVSSSPGDATSPRIVTTSVVKSDATVVNAVEIFDLSAVAPVAFVSLSESPANAMGGTINIDPSSQTAYITVIDTSFVESIFAVSLSSRIGVVTKSATDNVAGHIIPASGLPVPAASQIQQDGTSLVRFASGARLQWIDLATLSLIRQVQLPRCDCAKGYPVIALFAPDGTVMFAVDPAKGELLRVDLGSGDITGTLLLPHAPAIDHPEIAGAALSPDAKYLYMADGRGEGGLFTIRAADLQVVAGTLDGVHLRDIWISGDGQSVYALDANNDVYVVNAGGTRRAAVAIPSGTVLAFVR